MPTTSAAVTQFSQYAYDQIITACLKAAGAVLISLNSEEKTSDEPSKAEQFQQQFRDKFLDSFSQLGQATAAKTSPENTEQEDTLDARIAKYSLLDKEELEAQIAVDRFSRQIFDENQVAIAKLTLRLEEACGNRFDLNSNPLHPRQLSMYYSACCSTLARTTAARDAALNQWIKTLETLYANWLNLFNQYWVDQGILPTIREEQAFARLSGIQREEKAKAMRQEVLENITGRRLNDDETFNSREVLQHLGNLLEQAQRSNSSSIQRHILHDNQQGQVLSHTNVADALDAAVPDIKLDAASGYRQITAPQTLSEIVSEQTAIPEHKLDERTKSSISILSIMFETLLAEENLAEPIKPLLSALQVPVLQQALRDPDFFADANNPAQLFVNEIARAGTQWIPNAEAKRDIFYKKISGIVDTVRQQAASNPKVFAENLPLLNDFIDREERRSAKLEERLIQNELATSRQQAVEQQAIQTIANCFNNINTPAAITNFLQQHYQKVLLYALNQPEGNNPLLDQVLLNLNQLALATQGHEIDLRQLFQSINTHLLEQGLERTAREQDLQAVLNELKSCRIRQLQQQERDESARVAATTVKARVQEKAALATPAPTSTDSGAADIDDDFKQLAASLAVNIWFRYQPDSQQRSKLKLAAILRQKQNYIFVNRDGQKVINTDLLGLAELLRRGVLAVIEDTMLFDRALERVVQSLRN